MKMKIILVAAAVGTLLAGCSTTTSDSDSTNGVSAPTVPPTQLTNKQVLQLSHDSIQFGCFGTTGVYALYDHQLVLKDKDEHCPAQ